MFWAEQMLVWIYDFSFQFSTHSFPTLSLLALRFVIQEHSIEHPLLIRQRYLLFICLQILQYFTLLHLRSQ